MELKYVGRGHTPNRESRKKKKKNTWFSTRNMTENLKLSERFISSSLVLNFFIQKP